MWQQNQTIRVLLVEDNPDDLELTCLALSKATISRFESQHAGKLEDALAVLRESCFDVLLLDLGLPDSDGLAGLETIRRQHEDIPIVVLTGHSDEDTALQSLDHGAQDYLVKANVTAETLGRSIRYAVQRQQLLGEVTRANRLLENKNQRLAALYKTAHHFVDNVSHEFRTPLTVIKEYASLLREGIVGRVDDEQARFLDVIVDRADDLNTMVDDMLDVSKLESGMLGATREVHCVSSIIQHILPALQRKAAVRGVSLNVEGVENVTQVYCDAEKVGRIIINLTVNAIKFCRDPGAVRLWARPDECDGGVVIGVTDNGPGIDQENLDAIFARFRQLTTDCRSSTKGFGLGLNIAKELVDLNFGRMSVESEIGRGSTFAFTLPPADPSNVMQRYLNRVGHSRDGGAAITLACVATDDEVENGIADDTNAMLTYMLRRDDLLFRLGSHRWLLVLPIDQIEFEKFLQRADKTLHDANRNRPYSPLPNVEFRNEGTWQLPQEERELMQHFVACLERLEPSCV